MFVSNSAYREAVTEHSPGLPRFAATLGTELSNGRNPNNGVVTVFLTQVLEPVIVVPSKNVSETNCLAGKPTQPRWGCHHS